MTRVGSAIGGRQQHRSQTAQTPREGGRMRGGTASAMRLDAGRTVVASGRRFDTHRIRDGDDAEYPPHFTVAARSRRSAQEKNETRDPSLGSDGSPIRQEAYRS